MLVFSLVTFLFSQKRNVTRQVHLSKHTDNKSTYKIDTFGLPRRSFSPPRNDNSRFEAGAHPTLQVAKYIDNKSTFKRLDFDILIKHKEPECLTLRLFKEVDYYTRNATSNKATMFKILIIGLIAGPAVSL